MTLFACNCGVLARQRKPGQIMIEKNFVLPAVDIVAATAIGSQSRLMRIIIGMAANTSGWRQFNMRRLFVTRFAQHRFMRAFQREARHRVMIELGNLPVFAVMAFGAVGAIAAFVTVIFLVAADAGHWRCFDRVIDPVASGTSGRYMRTHELEACVLVVIEIDRFPGRRRMTFGTVRTPRALVRIFFGMTAIACA